MTGAKRHSVHRSDSNRLLSEFSEWAAIFPSDATGGRRFVWIVRLDWAEFVWIVRLDRAEFVGTKN